MDPYLTAFNNLTIKFLDELIDLFPQENDFKIYKRVTLFVNENNKRKICRMFKIYVKQYKQSIIDRDEQFLLETSYTDIVDRHKSEGLEQVIEKLKKYWVNLSDNNKVQIWEYLNTLLSLSEMTN